RIGYPPGPYTDRKNVCLADRAPILEYQLTVGKALTAFGRACQKLAIELSLQERNLPRGFPQNLPLPPSAFPP
ncbi:MAG TPA: hypothetical protein PK166_13100, partial [Candidatus Hydrogenedentes bacterium]|nr:hypothetical protein [Candidatus Hydrogenedentota bacterium]